jgi:hypothetical protein
MKGRVMAQNSALRKLLNKAKRVTVKDCGDGFCIITRSLPVGENPSVQAYADRMPWACCESIFGVTERKDQTLLVLPASA